MNRLLALFSILAILGSCAQKDPETDATLSTPIKPDSAITSDTTQIVNNLSLDTNMVNPVLQPPGNPSTTPVNIPASAGGSGMNPAHGQPGHRCDIAVGAPLNSPASKTAAQTPATISPVTKSTTATPTVVQTPAEPAKTLPGMNPAHGQPGHRCDISVGAPLNSPVTKPAIQPANPIKPGDKTLEKVEPPANIPPIPIQKTAGTKDSSQ